MGDILGEGDAKGPRRGQAVAEYKQSGSRDALIAGWKTLKERYPESYWARKLPL